MNLDNTKAGYDPESNTPKTNNEIRPAQKLTSNRKPIDNSCPEISLKNGIEIAVRPIAIIKAKPLNKNDSIKN